MKFIRSGLQFAGYLLLSSLSVAQPTASRLAVRRFIAKNWAGTVEYHPADTANLLGLPYPYSVPTAHGETLFRELYYWDTYFTNKGLLLDGHAEQAKNNTDDIIFMVNRFGKMLNGSNRAYLNRSQPPYLSMMTADIYAITKDTSWLRSAVQALETEYAFWMRERSTFCGLNRYSSSATDEDKLWMANLLVSRFNEHDLLKGKSRDEISRLGSHFTAEAESGWDFTPRFEGRCEDYCPLDLNSNLYIYEKNFALFYRELGDLSRIKKWERLARKRKKSIQAFCYDKPTGFFFDYDYVNKKKSPVVSAAVFSLLYAGVVTPAQAKALVSAALPKLETPYGLRACERRPYGHIYQWGPENGWPPLHFLAVAGLLDYHFDAEAKRISDKFITLLCTNFEKTGNLWEKYNMDDGSTNTVNEYQMPAFLGWTAGVFIALSTLDFPTN